MLKKDICKPAGTYFLAVNPYLILQKMIQVNRDTCCYCGGCVGVCPVDALELEETVLKVSEKCTECGICAKFCPVGALKKPAGGGK